MPKFWIIPSIQETKRSRTLLYATGLTHQNIYPTTYIYIYLYIILYLYIYLYIYIAYIQLLQTITKRMSLLSSDYDLFFKAATTYNTAMENAGSMENIDVYGKSNVNKSQVNS